MLTPPFDEHFGCISQHGRKAMIETNKLLDRYFNQQLAWYKDKDKSIRWRIISQDDPFWGQFHEWGAESINKSA